MTRKERCLKKWCLSWQMCAETVSLETFNGKVSSNNRFCKHSPTWRLLVFWTLQRIKTTACERQGRTACMVIKADILQADLRGKAVQSNFQQTHSSDMKKQNLSLRHDPSQQVTQAEGHGFRGIAFSWQVSQASPESGGSSPLLRHLVQPPTDPGRHAEKKPVDATG